MPNLAFVGRGATLRHQAYEMIKRSILAMDIYNSATEIRLDENHIARELGISRTPVREAMSLLEQEGLVRSIPRRGLFVVRKTKRELIEMITVWAALEGTAAYLAASRASDAELAELAEMFATFTLSGLTNRLDDYTDANIAFHQAIIRLGNCQLMVEMSANLFVHVRAIRSTSIRQDGRPDRSMREHAAIIAALQARAAERAAILVRDHALGLAGHVEAHWTVPKT
ncbi:DNA-binding GntR family transcriptional regulator [Methylobacterium sp. BE186]|uniref:GntR family transcriptional regulator n=1 Tax=Methylobacterium sp. BE186 TaxID=2817715 RepID=UPI00285CF11C|nr:GntR family transcriptional regulator [Methylobacterium sp. BE186]MDR7038467.1 DNA-binding GntR family transcriptional regulator [Methylobacterium sp. BE186]